MHVEEIFLLGQWSSQIAPTLLSEDLESCLINLFQRILLDIANVSHGYQISYRPREHQCYHHRNPDIVAIWPEQCCPLGQLPWYIDECTNITDDVGNGEINNQRSGRNNGHCSHGKISFLVTWKCHISVESKIFLTMLVNYSWLL